MLKKHYKLWLWRKKTESNSIPFNSNMFDKIIHLDLVIVHKQSINDCIEAWKSHATLERQVGDKFSSIIKNIEEYLNGLNTKFIEIPYLTNVWLARLKD